MTTTLRTLFLLLALVPVSLHAAINGTARGVVSDACATGDWGSSACEVNVSGVSGFAANDLLVYAVSRNDDGFTAACPTGFTLSQDNSVGTANSVGGLVCWKKATGSETTIQGNLATGQAGRITVAVFDGTDLNLTAEETSGQDNSSTAAATHTSGEATNASDALGIAVIATDNGVDNDVTAWSNSWTSQGGSGSGTVQAESFIASKVLSASATQSTTATITSDQAWGGILLFAKSVAGCPATCVDGPSGPRSARCITNTASNTDPDNILYGQSPAVVANEDTICHDATSTLGDAVSVSASGWVTIDSLGSNLTDSFDYCIMDAGAACGTDGTYEVTFQPVITSVTGIGTGQTTADITVTPAGPTEGTVRGVAILKSVYDLYGPPDHDQIAAGVDANYDGVSWGSEFTSDLATPDVWTNLARQSEAFGTTWTASEVSVTSNSVPAPDGETTADTLSETTANAQHRVYDARTTTTSAWTHSVYAKAGTRSWIYLRLADSGNVTRYAWFDLTNGVVGTVQSGLTASIEDADDGWYRCIITISSAYAGSNNNMIGLATGDGSTSYAGATDKNVYLWGAQLEAASTAGPYTPTVADARARFDGYTFSRASSQTYTKSDGTLGTVTSGNPAFTYSGGTAQGVLLEGARTNLAKYSDDLSNAVWVATNITKGSTSTTGIYGSAITTVEATASAANGTLLQTVTASSAAYTYSTYLKRKTGTGNIDITVNGGTGWTTCTVTASWSPCSVTATVTNPQIGIRIVTSGDAVYMQGSQVEAGSFRSSTIYTTTGSVARQATSLTRSWNFPSNNFSGQIKVRPQFDGTASKGGTYSILTMKYDNNNYARITFNSTTDRVHLARYATGTGGDASTTSTELGYTSGQLLNIRFKFTTTGVYLWVDDPDSSTVDSCTSADCLASFTNAPTTIRLGDVSADTASTSYLMMAVESLTIWNEAKSDAFLEALE